MPDPAAIIDTALALAAAGDAALRLAVIGLLIALLVLFFRVRALRDELRALRGVVAGLAAGGGRGGGVSAETKWRDELAQLEARLATGAAPSTAPRRVAVLRRRLGLPEGERKGLKR